MEPLLMVDQAADETVVAASLLGGPWLAGRRSAKQAGGYIWCKDPDGVLHLRHARLTEEQT